jgi:hypothetical protein
MVVSIELKISFYPKTIFQVRRYKQKKNKLNTMIWVSSVTPACGRAGVFTFSSGIEKRFKTV